MKAENVGVLILRLQAVIAGARAAILFLRRYENAQEAFGLTSGQKVEAMEVVAGMASGISEAYDEAVEAFVATEAIDISQPDD